MLIATALLVACKTEQKAVKINQEENLVELSGVPAKKTENVWMRGGDATLPPAIIYKTNGDFDNNVAAVYNGETGNFISFPGPGDVTTHSAPIRLKDGWLLDRQGMIGPNTVFLKWTYEEYHELPELPTISALRAAIIPGCRVIDVKRIEGITSETARTDTALVNRYIESLVN